MTVRTLLYIYALLIAWAIPNTSSLAFAYVMVIASDTLVNGTRFKLIYYVILLARNLYRAFYSKEAAEHRAMDKNEDGGN